MEELSRWVINYLNNNQGLITFFELIAAVFTVIIFLGILGLTWWYASSTNKLAIKTSESIEITKEKEKKDRTLSFIDKIDLDRYDRLNRLKFADYPLRGLDLREKIEWVMQEMNFNPDKNNSYKGLKQRLDNLNFLNEFPKAKLEIIYFLSLFDTISIFYNENELDKKLFDSKLKLLFLNLFINFIDEIIEIMNNYINYENLYGKYDNYLNAIEEISDSHEPSLEFLKENIKKCRETKLFIESLDNKNLK